LPPQPDTPPDCFGEHESNNLTPPSDSSLLFLHRATQASSSTIHLRDPSTCSARLPVAFALVDRNQTATVQSSML
jgi:hypothetical protein